MTLPRAYEDQLVERAKGDADAFGELYDHYFGQIYRFVYSRLRDQDAAEDVTSEVFFKALRAIGRYRSTGHPFSAWLYQISVNAIYDHYRSRRPTASLEGAMGVPDPARPVAERVVDSSEAERGWTPSWRRCFATSPGWPTRPGCCARRGPRPRLTRTFAAVCAAPCLPRRSGRCAGAARGGGWGRRTPPGVGPRWGSPRSEPRHW